MKGRKSHKIVAATASQILLNLEHRGAVGADPRAGDGAGMPRSRCPTPSCATEAEQAQASTLPEPGHYAVGFMCFLPQDDAGEGHRQRSA